MSGPIKVLTEREKFYGWFDRTQWVSCNRNFRAAVFSAWEARAAMEDKELLFMREAYLLQGELLEAANGEVRRLLSLVPFIHSDRRYEYKDKIPFEVWRDKAIEAGALVKSHPKCGDVKLITFTGDELVEFCESVLGECHVQTN